MMRPQLLQVVPSISSVLLISVGLFTIRSWLQPGHLKLTVSLIKYSISDIVKSPKMTLEMDITSQITTGTNFKAHFGGPFFISNSKPPSSWWRGNSMSSDNDPGFWARVVLWLYAHKTEWGYAGVACMFSLLRSAYAKSPWSKRVLDAVSCSALAFFAAPTLQVIGALMNWNAPDAAAQIFAVFIGYVGNDYISEKLHGWINRKTGGNDANQQ